MLQATCIGIEINYKNWFTPSVFNLEISQSGSSVPHVILNWVILEMVRVKLWYTKKKLWKINIIKTIQRIRFQFFMFFSLIPLLKWKVGLHEHTALLQVVRYIKLKLIFKKWQTNFKLKNDEKHLLISLIYSFHASLSPVTIISLTSNHVLAVGLWSWLLA